METEKVNIRHTFTDPERLTLGEEQARLLGKKDELDASLTAAKRQLQAQIDEAEAGIRKVSSKLRDHFEFRDIECLIMDHRGANGVRHLVRADTGHIVKARSLRPDELQQKLTTEAPKEFIAVALCPVDDHAVDGDFVELRIFDDEFEVLRKCPDVKLRDVPKGIADGRKSKGATAKGEKQ